MALFKQGLYLLRAQNERKRRAVYARRIVVRVLRDEQNVPFRQMLLCLYARGWRQLPCAL